MALSRVGSPPRAHGIDTSRLFSVGFSFGAMFTNSLAQTHQDTLRSVTVYAAADYNIYFPTKTGKPLAYFGVHGTADNTCRFKARPIPDMTWKFITQL
jgi:predicted esterase